jgi:hypothetical protein
MENTRRQGIKDGYSKKTRKDSFTATERSCHSRTSELLWMDFFCRRGTTDGHFGRGDNEKGLIIGARYWGLEFLLVRSVVTESPKITGNQTVTPLNEVLLIEI